MPHTPENWVHPNQKRGSSAVGLGVCAILGVVFLVLAYHILHALLFCK